MNHDAKHENTGKKTGPPTKQIKQKTRQATLYDAVSGCCSRSGFIRKDPLIPSTRDTASSSNVAIPPDEVLFRQSRAPTRYAEDDFYWANRKLGDDQELPNSDLLMAIRNYAGEFYARSLGDQADSMMGSMDETALLSIGIIIEETIRHHLGETGDLALTEGVSAEEAGVSSMTLQTIHASESGTETETESESESEVSSTHSSSQSASLTQSDPPAKRRKR